MANKAKSYPGIETKPGVILGVNYAGVDQGVDFRGKGLIPALGAGVVTDVGTSSILEGGTYPFVVYKLTSGPKAGQYIYVAENFIPSVQKGTRLKAGESIGKAVGSYPYIEIGFNKSGSGWNPVAPLGQNPHAATNAGNQMLSFMEQVTGASIASQQSIGSSTSSAALAGLGCIVPVLLIMAPTVTLLTYFLT